MIRNYLTKMLSRPEQPARIDPRERLQTLVNYRRKGVEDTREKVVIGLESQAVLDRERANLVDAEQALADFDAARAHAAAAEERRAEHGAAVLKKAQAADAKIEAAALALQQALDEALPIADEITRDFRLPGRVSFEAPFTGSPLVERLTFWSRGVTAIYHGMTYEDGRFTDRLREYRGLVEPPAPPLTIHRPTPETAAQKAKRREQAMRNSRVRFVSPNGVDVLVEHG